MANLKAIIADDEGSIINVSQIANVSRSFAGRLFISLKNLPGPLTVSRSYAHLFKQM